MLISSFHSCLPGQSDPPPEVEKSPALKKFLAELEEKRKGAKSDAEN
jgi:hypothetical protein